MTLKVSTPDVEKKSARSQRVATTNDKNVGNHTIESSESYSGKPNGVATDRAKHVFLNGSCSSLTNNDETNNNTSSKCNANGTKNGHTTLHKRNGFSVSPTQQTDYNRYLKEHPNAKLIGVNGCWYDITTFIPHHPGGDLIEHFIGKDATPVFKAFHHKDVLKHRRPVGQYVQSSSDPAAEAFANLHLYFINNGFFKTSLTWYLKKVAVTFLLFGLTWYLVACQTQWYMHYLAALTIAAFWQQCGFFMHDFMHNQGFHNRKIDRWLGLLFGTTGLGVNGHWWRDEHYVHHALTNTVDYGQQFFDPQMREPIWAQNEKLFPFYSSYIEELCIRIQHITFIPICVIVGRIGIMLDGFKTERRWYEWLAFILHWSWMSLLFSFLPTWRQVIIFYSLASIFQGILHIQLLISHYCKDFFQKENICVEKNWYRMQIECNINIKNPVWLDWFHGGLNFHIEHHLYPLMPRHKYREASVHIRRVCKELGIHYDECGWFEAIKRTLIHLKKMSTHFKLDPR